MKKLSKQIRTLYIIASIVWIFGCLLLRVTNTNSPLSYVIISFPLFVYALGYLNSHRVCRKVEKTMLMTDFLAIALLLSTILLEMYHHNAEHYTVNIMVVAFIILMLSMIDFPIGDCSISLVRHIKSIFRTAAITLLTYVIFINVTTKVPMKANALNQLNLRSIK